MKKSLYGNVYLPGFRVMLRTHPVSGYYYFESSPETFVVDNLGVPVFYAVMDGGVRNFSIHENGMTSYYDVGEGVFILLDSLYNPLDTLSVQGGFTTDFHHMSFLPGGNQLMLGTEYRVMDLSGLIPGGKLNATVTGAVIQETDPEGNLLFEWGSLDHIPVTDSDTCLVDLTASTIDYIHVNSVELAPDGNFLVSARNLSQVFKLDRETGEVLWRLGGKGNQFTLPVEQTWFSAQHTATIPEAGKLLLLDNGFCHDPRISRVVVYSIDEEGKMIEEAEELTPAQPVFSAVMGSVRRYADSTILAGWGKNNRDLVFSEFLNHTPVLEMNFGTSEGAWSYGVTKGPVRHRIIAPLHDTLDFGLQEAGQDNKDYVYFRNLTNEVLEITGALIHGEGFTLDTLFPIELQTDEELAIPVVFAADTEGAHSGRLTLFADYTSREGLNIQAGSQMELKGYKTAVNYSVQTQTGDKSLYVFPNPAGDFVKLICPEKMVLLRVFRPDGSLILELVPDHYYEYELVSSHWLPGIYYIQAVTSGGNSYVARVAK